MSNIEWTGETWNPILGCDKVSPGCKNCYAIRTAWIRQHNPKMKERFAGLVEKTPAGQLNWTGKINLVEEALLKPLRTKKPTIFFVNSMSDLFHEGVSFAQIDQIYAVMALCPQHTFQILTKRPERMLEYFKSRDDAERMEEAAEYIACNNHEYCYIMETYKIDEGKEKHPTNDLLPHIKAAGWHSGIIYVDCGEGDSDKELEFIYEGKLPLPNVWLGVSVENQKTADERIPLLLQVPAAVRFLSCEPLLNPVDISSWFYPKGFLGMEVSNIEETEHSTLKNDIHWVICGGESGPGARPMHPDWARSLRDQCKAAGVAFFFKQWGEYYTRSFLSTTEQPHFRMFQDYTHWINKADTWVRGGRCISIDGRECKMGADFAACDYPVAIMDKVGKKKAGRLLDGVEWNEMPADKTK